MCLFLIDLLILWKLSLMLKFRFSQIFFFQYYLLPWDPSISSRIQWIPFHDPGINLESTCSIYFHYQLCTNICQRILIYFIVFSLLMTIFYHPSTNNQQRVSYIYPPSYATRAISRFPRSSILLILIQSMSTCTQFIIIIINVFFARLHIP